MQINMSELRNLVIEAHGGIARWRKFKTIEGAGCVFGTGQGANAAVHQQGRAT
jgi:hypothetical protein